MASASPDRETRDSQRRSAILQRATELMGVPLPLADITVGRVSQRSGIPASTILSQSGLDGDDDQGRAEVFRRLLFRRLVSEVDVTLSARDRDALIGAAADGPELASIIGLLVDSLGGALVASPHASYLLAAVRHHDDPLLDAEVEAKWTEITSEPVFLLRLLAASAGYVLAPGADDASLRAGLALAVSIEFIHRTMMPELAQPTFPVDGAELGPGALVLWGLITPILRPLRSELPPLGQAGLARGLEPRQGGAHG